MHWFVSAWFGKVQSMRLNTLCAHTIWLVIFVDLNFCGLRSSDDFVALYFRGLPL